MSSTALLTAQLDNLRNEALTAKAHYDEALDTIWMLLAALLVFFMHAGFSMLEAGSVRGMNALGILSKNMLVVTIGFLSWYIFGWATAFGVRTESNRFVGSSGYFLDGAWDSKEQLRMFFFQGAFSATAATIVSGAMAERTSTVGFAIYCILMTSIIYPFVVYWSWSGSGFLSYNGGESIFGPAYMDFAGSGIVHLVGGIGALCGCAIVGPRKDRFNPAVPEDKFSAHNIPFVVMATFFLWFGWYGFNPGSTLEMHTAEKAHQAGLVAVNTTLAPCVAGLTVFFLRAKVVAPKRKDVGGFCNGVLAGLVSITAGCAYVKSWEALIIGLVGGVSYQGVSMLMTWLELDDVVDAVAVHGACGLWGVVAVGLFGDPDHGMGGNGAFYGGDQLGVQIMAVIVIFAWTFTLSVVVFSLLRVLGLLRLSDDYQDVGADLKEHSPTRAYTPERRTSKTSQGDAPVEVVASHEVKEPVESNEVEQP
mmetsp:Transcript_29719/g.78911  ORF Transcript_29719/g.78911 Transcript_29719/m.78911 type:complete len:478 (-) Transcript_29719:112-1545(-)